MELHGQAGDARLPVLGGRVLRVELVPGDVVADRADNAAVLRVDAVRAVGVVVVDAPVDPAGEADDRQDADVHAGAEDRGGRRLVVGLVRDAGRVEAVVVGFEDDPLRQRVGVLEDVVALRVGAHRGGAAVHQRVLALAEREAEVRHARLAGVLLPVAVRVVEDVAVDLGEPSGQRQDAEVLVLAGGDRHLDQVQDVVLVLVPVGERVAAHRHAGDRERTRRRVRPDELDGLVLVAEIRERDPGILDRRVDLGAAQAAPDRAGEAGAPLGRDIDLGSRDNARDRPRLDAGACGEGVCRELPVRGVRGGCLVLAGEARDVAEDRERERLAGDHELRVVTGRALHQPGVPVVVALEGGRLDPALARRGDRGHRVAVRPEVRDLQEAPGDRRVRGCLPEVVVVTSDSALDDAIHVRVAAEAFAALAQDDGPAVNPLVPVGARAGLVRRAQRIAEDVRVDLAEVVGKPAGEAGDAVLARVVLAVRRRHVGEDLRGRRCRGQRQGLERDLDHAGVSRDTERRAVQLVPVGEHGDEVAAVRQGDPGVAVQG